jgi:putative ATP-dependent endonuclease of OLD family
MTTNNKNEIGIPEAEDVKNKIPKLFIKELSIENFKCFNGKFNLKLNQGLNILVGDNEAGKSTILEAIHLTLSGWLNGRYLKNELTQYLFNNEVVAEYLAKINNKEKQNDAILPYILIEMYIGGDDLPLFQGDGNSEGKKECCISLKIAFSDKYQSAYAELVKSGEIKTLPVEYYEIDWKTCARGNITSSESIPIKSDLIDSSNYRYQNGSDVCISHIVHNHLNEEEIVAISQAHRKMRDVFMDDEAVRNINTKIETATSISNKKIKLSVELSSKNAWESSLMTYLDDVPFHYIGKGEQCMVKTKLALSKVSAQKANMLLLEEPENHLSHSTLNQLIREIKEAHDSKQIIISTHSSFVANKLGLDSLILLNINNATKKRETVRFDDLELDTKKFFERLAGYDTLRLLLCKKAILVEGDSDELVVQKAYMKQNGEHLPIQEQVDVISVGTSFLRFLELAEKINKSVVVVTDNDHNYANLQEKYKNYIDGNKKDNIDICFDTNDTLYSLEPQIVNANKSDLDTLRLVLDITVEKYPDEQSIIEFMELSSNKTACALKIFDTTLDIKFPQYILDAVK